MKEIRITAVIVFLFVLSVCGAFGYEDFMMRAVRDTMEGDAERIAQHLFPKAEFESVKTVEVEKKLKEIHPRDMIVKMSGGITITFRITGQVHRKNTGGLPYTIEVIDVSALKCIQGRKKLVLLPEGAKEALAGLKSLTKEKASAAALAAYASEKVEDVVVGAFAGKHDVRKGTATVKMTNGLQVVLTVKGGYRFDSKTNKIMSHVAGFEKAVYTKNGAADTPKTPIPLIKSDKRNG